MNKDQIINIKNQAISAILEAKSKKDLETLRINYLGRKGQFSNLLKEIVKIKPEERGEFGKTINFNKNAVSQALEAKLSSIAVQEKTIFFDTTIPGDKPPTGHLHLITQTINEIIEILEKIGFAKFSYPEVEWDWFTFEGLNMPKNHPARDEWETFFIENLESQEYGKAVLTPHTSNGQLREMLRAKKPPIRMLNIAKCYRRQVDVSHAPMFTQFEGLLIDKNINITHLKGTLDYFVKQYFGEDRETRIRPFHFQFTEPSFEIDITCIICKGRGCKVCKEGWLEIGGAGMVHPTVLKNGGINPDEFSGFAWGWGVERLMMMKYSVDDIRLLFNGDLRFLNQF